MTPERARSLWAGKGAFGKIHATPEEDLYVSDVADAHGYSTWADAMLAIGRNEECPRCGRALTEEGCGPASQRG